MIIIVIVWLVRTSQLISMVSSCRFWGGLFVALATLLLFVGMTTGGVVAGVYLCRL